MKSEYQQMEEGGEQEKEKSNAPTMNNNNKQAKQFGVGNIANLMKSRISTEIPPKEFILQFKYILIYMIVIIIASCVILNNYFFFGLINLSLAIIGFTAVLHGILKQLLKTYKIGTAFWILELLAITVEIGICVLILFGDIFKKDTNFFLGLLKFIGFTVLLGIILLGCAFCTYQIMQKKSAFEKNKKLIQNSNDGIPHPLVKKPKIITPGTVSKDEN